MADSSEWAFPAELRPKPNELPLRSRGGARRARAGSRRDPGGRLHRVDARHRAHRQRRGHPRRRAGAHDRLPDHRSDRDLADDEPGRGGRRASRSRTTRRRASASSSRSARSAFPRSSAGRGRIVPRRRKRRACRPWRARARAQGARCSPSGSSPATGSTCSTRRVFTAPAHPQWGGAALIGADGRLLGIGSLLVQEQVGDERDAGQHDRADRPAGADPRRHARARTLAASGASVARHVHDRSRRPARRRGPSRRRPGRACGDTGRGSRARGRGRARCRAGGALPQGLEPRPAGHRDPAHDRARRPRCRACDCARPIGRTS